METLLRPMGRSEFRLFLVCLAVSLVAHLVVAWFAVGRGEIFGFLGPNGAGPRPCNGSPTGSACR